MTLVRMWHGSKNMSIGRSCNSKCNTATEKATCRCIYVMNISPSQKKTMAQVTRQTSALSARASLQCRSEQCGSTPRCCCGTTNVETPPKSYWDPCPSASLSTPQKSFFFFSFFFLGYRIVVHSIQAKEPSGHHDEPEVRRNNVPNVHAIGVQSTAKNPLDGAGKAF